MMKLNNGEIYGAWQSLGKLMPEKFPVRVSMGLAKLRGKLQQPYKEIEEVRNGLIQKYGKKEEDGGIGIVGPNDPKGRPISPNWEKFAEEFNELMAQEGEVTCDKVKLPEKVAATCDKCNHNMDKMLEIEPNILMFLEKFIEVE